MLNVFFHVKLLYMLCIHISVRLTLSSGQRLDGHPAARGLRPAAAQSAALERLCVERLHGVQSLGLAARKNALDRPNPGAPAVKLSNMTG